MKSFLIALQFLTIFPLKLRPEVENSDYGRSLLYFPVVGLLIGVTLFLFSLLFRFFPSTVLAALILIVLVFLSGGLHLDGFADSCDGLYGLRTRERRLEIMRDSHIGTLAVIGLILLLLLKFTLLETLLKNNFLRPLILMPVFSRWIQVFTCFSSNYSRSEGKAKNFIEYARFREFFIATLITVSLFILLMGLKGVLLLVLSFLIMLLIIRWMRKKIDGVTGDTIGAGSEIAEVLVLLFGLMMG